MGKKEQIIELWATGQFKTQGELANSLSVTPAYVSSVLVEAEGRTPQKKVNGDYFDSKSKDVDTALVKACEKGNAQALRTYYQLTQRLIEKREDIHKVEFTPADHTRIARETVDGLRAQYQRLGGRCVVCGQSKALRIEARLDTEPEQPEDREVATVALLTRPD